MGWSEHQSESNRTFNDHYAASHLKFKMADDLGNDWWKEGL